MSSEERDELDRLYEKVEWENPRQHFTQRVLERAHWAQRVQRISTAVTLAALALLALSGFALGRGLSLSGTLDYFWLLIDNFDLVANAADDFVAGLGDVVPWLELLAVALGLLCVWVAAAALPRWLAQRHSQLRTDV